MAIMTFNSVLFTYNGVTQTFATEISDLAAEFGTLFNFDGKEFYISSIRTGNTKLFLYERTEYDREGDLVAWHYFVPGEGLRAVIFND